MVVVNSVKDQDDLDINKSIRRLDRVMVTALEEINFVVAFNINLVLDCYGTSF